MAIAPHRYRVEGDVNGRILNGRVRHAFNTLSAHLRHEFALEVCRKVTAHHELRVVTLKDLARDYGAVWKEKDEPLLKLVTPIVEIPWKKQYVYEKVFLIYYF